MGNGRPGRLPAAAAFGEMDFQKRPVATAELGKGMQGLDDARALGPAAADPGGKCHHGDFAVRQRRFPGTSVGIGQARAAVQHIPRFDIADVAAGRQTVLRQADAPLL